MIMVKKTTFLKNANLKETLQPSTKLTWPIAISHRRPDCPVFSWLPTRIGHKIRKMSSDIDGNSTNLYLTARSIHLEGFRAWRKKWYFCHRGTAFFSPAARRGEFPSSETFQMLRGCPGDSQKIWGMRNNASISSIEGARRVSSPIPDRKISQLNFVEACMIIRS